VPLNADHPPTRVAALDAFDRAVVGMRVDAHRGAKPIDGLMVDRVHGERLCTKDRREAR
jgi:hypothetical protein